MISQELMYFAPLLHSTPEGISQFEPEVFRPNPGYLLAVVPPPVEETQGGLFLPEMSRVPQNIARVCAVPDDPNCLYQQGDWIMFMIGSGLELPLSGRTDLRLLAYTRDAESEVLGKFIDDGPVTS